MVFQAGSAQLRAARILFGIGESGEQIQLLPADHIGQQKLELIRREILASLDIEVQTPVVESDMDIVLAKFGKRFPTTREMSEFARSQTDLGTRDPDDALLAWVDREEQLFRALEEVIIKDRIREGFAEVDDFISYSLSVQNRRKSRMGHALQHHLAAVFTGSGVQFEEQVRTEGGNKPDFIFPGALQYRDPGFPEDSLLMLGVKSSAKDRWRQILPEAERIKNKHLCTLEHGISENQTRQMQQMSVTLVIPEGIHPTYSDDQRRTLLNLGAFIELVRSRQS